MLHDHTGSNESAQGDDFVPAAEEFQRIPEKKNKKKQAKAATAGKQAQSGTTFHAQLVDTTQGDDATNPLGRFQPLADAQLKAGNKQKAASEEKGMLMGIRFQSQHSIVDIIKRCWFEPMFSQNRITL